jgi:Ku protein
MARPTWSGQIQISLVSFGVSLYVATDSKSQINFHQISRSTGERVRHQKVLQSAVDQPDGEAAEVVEKDEIVKGYEYSKGKYVVIEPSELENLRVPSKHVIAVDQFIDQDELNPEYVEKPYFVVPENDGQSEAFAVVRQALENTGKVAIGKVAMPANSVTRTNTSATSRKSRSRRMNWNWPSRSSASEQQSSTRASLSMAMRSQSRNSSTRRSTTCRSLRMKSRSSRAAR